MSAGTDDLAGLEPLSGPRSRRRRARDRPSAPGGGEHPLAVVAARQRLDDAGLALGEQAGEEQAGLDLGAGDRHLVGDPVQRRALRSSAAAGAPRGSSGRAPICAQRLGDAVDRPAADRVVAVERPARRPPARRASPAAAAAGCRRCRRRSPPTPAPRRPTPRTADRRRRSPAGADSLDLGAERLAPRPGSSGCRRRRGSPRSSSPPPPSRRSAPPGGRSTCRPAGAGSRAAGRRGRSGSSAQRYSPTPRTVTEWPSRGPAPPRALGLLVAGDPERDRAGGHVGGRVERHVLDVDPGLAEGQRQLGDRARAGWRRRSAARAAGPPASSASSRRRRSSPAPACQATTRVAVAAADQLGGLAAGARASDSTASATASRLLAKMSPQIAGLEPATRVASRKLGPDLGHPLGVAGQLGGGLCDEDVGDDVRQVADRRHQAVVGVGVDRLRAGAEAGDGPLQAVVEEAAGALGRGQVPAGALEEVGAGVLDPGGLGAGQRVAADEALVGAERRDELALGRADVGDDRLGAAGGEGGARPAPEAPRPARRRRPPRPPRRPRRREPAPRSIAPELDGPLERRRVAARTRPPRPPAAAARRARSSPRSGRRRGRRPSSTAPGLDRRREALEDRDRVAPSRCRRR